MERVRLLQKSLPRFSEVSNRATFELFPKEFRAVLQVDDSQGIELAVQDGQIR